MADESQTWTGLSLEARHVPEPDETYDPAAYDDPNHVTGFIDVGTVIDGVFVPLLRRKAPGVFADIARAKASGYTPSGGGSAVAETPPADTSALEARIAALESAQSASETGPSEQTPPQGEPTPQQPPSPQI